MSVGRCQFRNVKYSCLLAMVELNSRIGNICAPKYTNTFRIMIRITQSAVLFHFQFGSSLCFIRIYVYFVYMFMFIASNVHTEIHFYYQYWIRTTLFWRFRYKWICVKFLFSPFYPQYIIHSCWYFWNARIKRIRNIYVIGRIEFKTFDRDKSNTHEYIYIPFVSLSD